MPLAVFKRQTGFGKESTWGTGVAPTFGMAITGPKPKDDIKALYDDGLRGSPAKDFAYFPGVRQAMFDGDSLYYPDDTPNLLMAILGTDAVTGAGPYTHALTAALTPPSYTISDFLGITGSNSRQYAGCYLSELSFKWATDADLKVSFKWGGKASTLIAQPTEAYTALTAVAGWQAALTLGGSSDTRLIDAEVTIKRQLEAVWGANNSQDPTAFVPGPLEVSGKLTVAPDDFTEYAYYTGNTQPTASILFTAGANTLTLQMTKTAIEAAQFETGKTFHTLPLSFKAIANSTDGTASILSPIKAIVVNSRSTTY
ncbi:MAG: phage tail tube protein [Candidatus Dormibacteria bacterium]